jgi:hypothetical protein
MNDDLSHKSERRDVKRIYQDATDAKQRPSKQFKNSGRE